MKMFYPRMSRFRGALLVTIVFVCLSCSAKKEPEKVEISTGDSVVANEGVLRERAINLAIEIDAPVEKVFRRWTSSEEAKTFFAPASEIEPKPLGKFNIYFFPDNPVGQRGAENNHVMAIQENEMLSFTWEASPQWPEIRKHKHLVIVRFYKIAETKTRCTLTAVGWGNGKDWDEVFSYFISAWGEQVLPFLKYSLETGPVDWNDFPNKLPQGLAKAESF
jgi:uncharacterized protein YndB with AHSA1/START domain